MRRVIAVAAGAWLLIDLLRVWAPSLITIFGQAASTPAELMGAFALGCVLAGLLPRMAVRLGVPPMPVLRGVLVVALAARAGLAFTDGGAAQLWVASVGVAAAVAWTVLAAEHLGAELVEGWLVGIALATVTHAGLGTWGAVWRDDAWGWSLLALQVVLVVSTLREEPSGPAPARLALAMLPAWLVAGIWAANPARASVASPDAGPMVVVLAVLVAVGLARWAPARPDLTRRALPVAAAVLTLASALVLLPVNSPPWFLIAFALGMPALAVVLVGIDLVGRAGGTGGAVAWAASGGALAWVVLFFVYYAGYDLGYRADLAIVVLCVALVALGVTSAEVAQTATDTTYAGVTRARSGLRAGAGMAAVCVLVALFGPHVTVAPVTDGVTGDTDGGLRVVAWNLRMGYGIDGQFDPAAVAREIAAQDPDVVLLSEVDRAWLLNGGQDQLQVLARLLDLDAHFGPAADAVWGDAILTNLPITRVRSQPLDSFGAVTGAQVLAGTVTKDGQAWDVLSTHIQPHPVDEGEDGSLAQALIISGLALRMHESGNPTIVGGDFNLEPGDPSWDVMTGTGLVDALDGARPLPTSPADAPEQQIDHVFTSPDLAASDVVAFGRQLSDHLGVAVTLRPAR
ncbi:endonuclease/exonuclease/phosphatase family protein [Nocardioides sp. AE5]|uniref:endonuclease/exonuclease/phosphatase family protein n=1 Tax=Nocardioides sp. AE5 TaxID=2962573 RepID=UPI00288175EE|nr:endonuclease/exonuclease/phosphatase family protein [Nocardioides sp. AE5]MDT0201274.1 endonuclease/exonuclease/phosphatase family protein [Nocardioides sp. AE5]